MNPLREMERVRQVPGEPLRRRFHSPEMDLTIWLDDDERLVGFQLCYDKLHREGAMTWKRGELLRHTKIDDGESHALRYKASPILVSGGEFDRDKVTSAFLTAMGDVPPKIVSEIVRRLEAYHPDPATPQ